MTTEQLLNYCFPDNEEPLERIPEDGGFTSIFRKIVCVGDSLSSGEFETKVPGRKTFYTDCYEYSWGQFIARMCGSEVLNHSRAGMTAKEYMHSFADKRNLWDPAKKGQAYLVALGCNDVVNQGQPMGSTADICFEDWRQNKETFAGWYCQIIQRYKEIAPDAKFFLLTIPKGSNEAKNEIKARHRELMFEIQKVFTNTYVIDLNTYFPVTDDNFRAHFNMHSHLNPCGYYLTGKLIAAYIDWIIRHNIKDFNRVALINTELSDTNYRQMVAEAEREIAEKKAAEEATAVKPADGAEGK